MNQYNDLFSKADKANETQKKFHTRNESHKKFIIKQVDIVQTEIPPTFDPLLKRVKVRTLEEMEEYLNILDKYYTMHTIVFTGFSRPGRLLVMLRSYI